MKDSVLTVVVLN